MKIIAIFPIFIYDEYYYTDAEYMSVVIDEYFVSRLKELQQTAVDLDVFSITDFESFIYFKVDEQTDLLIEEKEMITDLEQINVYKDMFSFNFYIKNSKIKGGSPTFYEMFIKDLYKIFFTPKEDLPTIINDIKDPLLVKSLNQFLGGKDVATIEMYY